MIAIAASAVSAVIGAADATPPAASAVIKAVPIALEVAALPLRVGAAAIRAEHILVVVALVLGGFGGFWLARRRLRKTAGDGVHRILLPFTGTEISRRALDAAIRLARAEGGTLMPAYLATVPLQLPLGCPLPKEAAGAMAMLEAIEQRAAAQEVDVDARIERGRTYRHALERLLSEEDFDRVVVPAQVAEGSGGGEGLSGDDLVWLLRSAPAEVLILRPAPEDHRMIAARSTAAAVPGLRGGGGSDAGSAPVVASPR